MQWLENDGNLALVRIRMLWKFELAVELSLSVKYVGKHQ
jgi:hypothetical protein